LVAFVRERARVLTGRTQDHAPAEDGAAELSDERRGVMLSSVAATIIMLLKGHLKSLYGIAEEYAPCPSLLSCSDRCISKCMKWVPGKKSALGDKPATRRHERALIWERLPFATRLLLTPADADSQKKTVRAPIVV
jgi:cohesin loading factor subunit SCC2